MIEVRPETRSLFASIECAVQYGTRKESRDVIEGRFDDVLQRHADEVDDELCAVSDDLIALSEENDPNAFLNGFLIDFRKVDQARS